MTTYGADTSHWKWSAGVDFAGMKASGRCDYLIAKATEGTGYADPSYAGWRSGATGAGMLFGSFHFARPGDPVAQADYYLQVAKPVAGELVCLDLEDTAIPNAGDFAAAFWQRVKDKTGARALLYTYPDYLATRDLSPIQRLGCPLWFADYNDPLNPTAPWSSYAIRQFTSTGSLPGLPATNVDLNSSPLTIDQLRALAVGAAPQEDDMPLTPQDEADIAKYGSFEEAVAQRTRQVIATAQLPYGLDNLRLRLEAIDRKVTALAATADPAALAAELAKLLPQGTAPTDAQVLGAMRTLLGIPDGADAPAGS